MEIIIPILVVAAVVIFFLWVSKSGAKLLKVQKEKIDKAEKAEAKILGFSTVGVRGTGNYGQYQAYRFTLEVSNAFKTPYKTSSVWEVYPMGSPAVQRDMVVNVKIDVEDSNVIYPLAEGVEYSWLGSKLQNNK